MIQQGNYYIDQKLVEYRREQLLNSQRNHGIELVHDQGVVRRTLGSSLIRLGEYLRGRSESATTAEEDRHIAIRMAS